MIIVSPYLTFPSVGWWLAAVQADSILLDGGEHFVKMTERNRYRIAGANNSILLSVPLQNGRDQRTRMADIAIANEDNWQVQHWRTLVSAYNRSPYFMHYEPLLAPLYETLFDSLLQFNKATMLWVMQQLQLHLNLALNETTTYIKEYPADHRDLRHMKAYPCDAPPYHQVFMDRLGFLPGLSILDLLFCEGPSAAAWLRRHTPKG
ncbi:WbqC family protein [Nemorincola caseinilytica]|uniref:WbqC family protein n=1 Tax=Nemorincola caseinilytica TaxID=2054315 RepID=A0ABP8NP30_9BACT